MVLTVPEAIELIGKLQEPLNKDIINVLERLVSYSRVLEVVIEEKFPEIKRGVLGEPEPINVTVKYSFEYKE